jgi:DNA-binding XRE family transcriptional regulator
LTRHHVNCNPAAPVRQNSVPKRKKLRHGSLQIYHSIELGKLRSAQHLCVTLKISNPSDVDLVLQFLHNNAISADFVRTGLNHPGRSQQAINAATALMSCLPADVSFVALKRWANKRQQDFLRRLDLSQVFAANLLQFRRAKGLSQDDLAYQADVDRTYVSKLEKGSTYVDLEIIGKLAKVLDVQPAAFLVPPSRRKRGGG